jgi:Uma2 family endonuclease
MDQDVVAALIRERHEQGLDLYDEVWDGVYVMPSMPSLGHQELVVGLVVAFHEVVARAGRGKVYAGANISDRRTGWKENFRVPDVVVVLKGGRAVAYGAHLHGGPDVLVELESPGEEAERKIPFYSQIQVRELLIIRLDDRRLRLYRHDGRQLVPVDPSAFQGGRWLVSEVLPLAFRRKAGRGGPRTELRRTDDEPGHWIM